MATTKKLMGTTAVGGGALAIEDVFSTYLYTGNGSTQTITNGIDLAGEGGLVWIKDRTGAYSHNLVDSERGVNNYLFTDLTSAQFDAGSLRVSSFNSDGFSLGSGSNGTNRSGDNHASWTFRKAPRFFDVVTYTGDGATNRQIAHNLGVAPGCIIVKRTDSSASWRIYHHSIWGDDGFDTLQFDTSAADQNNSIFSSGGYSPTDSIFYVDGTYSVGTNTNGATYVAYLFAHDPLGPSGDGSDGLIACGLHTQAVTDAVEVVNLGWEAQWVLTKRIDAIDDWKIVDDMRGLLAPTANSTMLRPNLSNAESLTSVINANSSGFSFKTTAGQQHIYIAIRRGPMRQPTSGTEVFAMDFAYSATAQAQNPPLQYYFGFPSDAFIASGPRSGTNTAVIRTRLTDARLTTSSTAAETADNRVWYGHSMVGVRNITGTVNTDYIAYGFNRAPGFFDVVAYSGSTSNQNINHSLGVVPELIIIKVRNGTNSWPIYNKDSGVSNVLYLNQTWGNGSTTRWNSTTPTETQFTLQGSNSGSNTSGENYIAYLFASCPGVSKVGSYTGNGTSQTINCGFTTGARFILIKRTDSTGDWYIWDTARGIVAANDPHLSLNTTTAEVTTNDSIDPDSSGFIVNQVAATNINVSSATYIYLAIA